MKIVYTILTFTGCTIMFLSCSVCDCRKVPCAAFSDPLFDAWFPYSEGQRILFKDPLNEFDSTYISAIQTSGAYDASKGCYHSDYGCNSDKEITTSNQNFELLYQYEQPFTGDPSASIRVEVLGSMFHASGINDNGLKQDSASSFTTMSNYPTFILDNRQFQNVQVLENDTVAQKNNKVYKVYLSKGKGIIGFETFPDQQRWIIQ